MAELGQESRQWVSHCVMLLSCLVHREQSLLHIKKTYACQKVYRSEGEIPLGSIWLMTAAQEDRYCENSFTATESDEESRRWAPRQMVTLKQQSPKESFTIYISISLTL